MSKRKSNKAQRDVDQSSRKSHERASPPRRRWGRYTKLLIGVGTPLILWLVASVVIEMRTQSAFERRNLRGAVGWARIAQWLPPWNSDLKLTQARAARLAGDFEAWSAQMRPLAEKAKSPAVARELQLGRVNLGEFPNDFHALMGKMLNDSRAGEVAESFVMGFLLRQDHANARAVLDAWKRDEPQNPQVEFSEALLAGAYGDRPEMISRLVRFAEAHPEHEPARLRLIDIYLVDYQYQAALGQLTALVDRGDKSLPTLLKLAHCRRHLGDVQQAKALLDSALDVPADSLKSFYGAPQFERAQMELAQCELELGEYSAAAKRLRYAGVEQLPPIDQSDLALAEYMSGQTDAANSIYDAIAKKRQAAGRRADLEVYLQLNPDDEKLRREAAELDGGN